MREFTLKKLYIDYILDYRVAKAYLLVRSDPGPYDNSLESKESLEFDF